jgi:hypothetical protein
MSSGDPVIGRLTRGLAGRSDCNFSMEAQRKIQKNMTVYNFDTIDVDEKPEVTFKCLKRLVGERGFEPPTPWSRTRFRQLLNSIEFCRRQAIGIEGFAGTALLLVDLC